MKKKISISLILLILVAVVYAADVKWSTVAENTTVAVDDVLLLIDTGTGDSEKITSLNLFDMIDTFAELDGICADETLVSEEGTPTLDALWTFALGLTITTGDPLTLGVVRWDDGSDQIDGEQIANDTIDNDSIDWGDMTDLGEAGIVSADSVALTTDTTGNYANGNAEAGDALVAVAVEISDNDDTAENNPIVFVAGADPDGGDIPLETDSDCHYNPSTGTITATEFVGGGSALTSIDAATGDSATAFFDAGTIEHEWGGLQANISGYTGLIGITGADTTVEVDLLSELLTAMGDVTAFITDDDMPAAATDPDVDAAGEIGRDTDAAGETGDSSLRGFDGAAQFLYCKQIKHLSFTVQSPDSLAVWTGRVNPSTVVWYNTSGMTFTITEVYAISDTDNYDFTLFESNSGTDMSDDNDASIIAVECDADGTECFTDTEAAIGHAVEKDHAIIFEDTLGSANAVSITISGWFDSDVN